MKKTILHKITFVVAGLLITMASVWAQNPITPVDSALYKHTTNSSNTTGPVAGEAVEFVTTGGILKYYVLPDAIANPSFVVTSPLSNVVSTFTWNLTGATGTAAGTIAAVGANPQNYKQVTWSGLGSINLNVVENSSLGCASGDTVTTPVTIIKAPTAEFSADSAAARCISGTDGFLTQTLTAVPFLYASDVAATRNLKVTYNITCSNAGFLPVTGTVKNAIDGGAGTGTFDITQTLTHFGTYTITMTAINDRISTKSIVDGTLADINSLGGTKSTYTLVVSRIPVTGPMYHIPNF
jgi:hypothetical protein